MGSAIGLFEGASALRVPRSRFVPVKKTNDLLLLWSDVYMLDDAYIPRLAPSLSTPPLVTLDEKYYGLIGDLRVRFAQGAPSLVGARSFCVQGDVYFGANIVVTGDVCIKHIGPEPLYIADGTHLTSATSSHA